MAEDDNSRLPQIISPNINIVAEDDKTRNLQVMSPRTLSSPNTPSSSNQHLAEATDVLHAFASRSLVHSSVRTETTATTKRSELGNFQLAAEFLAAEVKETNNLEVPQTEAVAMAFDNSMMKAEMGTHQTILITEAESVMAEHGLERIPEAWQEQLNASPKQAFIALLDRFSVDYDHQNQRAKALLNEVNLAEKRMQAESFLFGNLEQELEEEKLFRKTCQESETHLRAELELVVLAEEQTAVRNRRRKNRLLKELHEVREQFQKVLCKAQCFDISNGSDNEDDSGDPDEVPDPVKEEIERIYVQECQDDVRFLLGARRRTRVEKEQSPDIAGSTQCGRKRPQDDEPAEIFSRSELNPLPQASDSRAGKVQSKKGSSSSSVSLKEMQAGVLEQDEATSDDELVKKDDENCRSWKYGYCKRGKKCPYKHEDKMRKKNQQRRQWRAFIFCPLCRQNA